MEDKQLLNVSDDQLGKVEIAPEVIEVIAGIAANEVSGVANMRGNLASNVTERFGKKKHGKGVRVDLSEEGIVIDIFTVLDYGVSIPTVAQKIQDSIRSTLKNMTALEILEINVHVVGIQIEDKNDEATKDQNA
ncbi:Asp23/Gls24 family envelope stress response protein [Filobacillus milosensis]|uniref:Asp23/Gls24 family envelope stress response protein n=1 Tax=Filobacillus milosensis TaxID=94137 RepID=A0A4Y8IQ95_9BACI|nr:Asp23/Gls24 family envelope stress response protein [Filobacillus milosensis]TFB23842.1 Asp23/Gls24 family envelope stress response protein [Filobacillus milosensis]